MGSVNSTLPTEKELKSVEGVETFFIDVDVSNCAVIYDYLLEKKIKKDANGKWMFENYKKIGEKSKKARYQISLLHRALNDKGFFEKKVTNSEDSQGTSDNDVQIASEDVDIDKISISDKLAEKWFNTIYEDYSQSPQTIPFCALPVFYPGQIIKGTVHLITNKQFDFENISINLFGGAKTQYRVHHGRGYYDVKGEEKYIDNSIILWRKSTTPKESKELMPGNYEWPFEFVLPSAEVLCPSIPDLNESEIYYGYVAYRLKATLNKDKLFSRGNITAHQGLWVEKDYDIGQLCPENLVNVIEEKVTKTGIFNNGFIKLQVSLPRSAYLVGETIPLRVELNNNGGDCMESINAFIQITGRFTTGTSKMSPNYKFKYLSDKKTGPAIANGKSAVFDWLLDMKFHDSAIDHHLLPPSFIKCNLINVFYHLVVEVERSGLHSNVRVKIPIMLGVKNSKNEKSFSYMHPLNNEE